MHTCPWSACSHATMSPNCASVPSKELSAVKGNVIFHHLDLQRADVLPKNKEGSLETPPQLATDSVLEGLRRDIKEIKTYRFFLRNLWAETRWDNLAILPKYD